MIGVFLPLDDCLLLFSLYYFCNKIKIELEGENSISHIYNEEAFFLKNA